VRKKLLLAVPLLLAPLAFVALSPQHALRLAMHLERGRAGLEEKVVVVDEHEVHYLDGGEGEPILLIHGFGADKDNWTRVARYLTDRRRVIAIDLPGFGQSSRRPEKRYDTTSQAARLDAFAEAIGLPPHHVAGNSMGGHIAGVYAADFPKRVRSVTFIANGGVTSSVASELAQLRAKGDNPLLVTDRASYERLIDFCFVERPLIPGAVIEHFAKIAVKNSAFTKKVWDDLMGHPRPLEPLLPSIAAPSFILWGDTDRLLHVSSIDAMRPLLPALRGAVVMKACGHVPMVERPEEAARHYLGFLDGLSKT